MHFYVSLVASVRTCAVLYSLCPVSHMVLDLHWPMCCSAYVRGPAGGLVQSLIASTQARIYARAPGAANFQGRHIKKIEIEVWYAEKKRLSTREKFKGDLY